MSFLRLRERLFLKKSFFLFFLVVLLFNSSCIMESERNDPFEKKMENEIPVVVDLDLSGGLIKSGETKSLSVEINNNANTDLDVNYLFGYDKTYLESDKEIGYDSVSIKPEDSFFTFYLLKAKGLDQYLKEINLNFEYCYNMDFSDSFYINMFDLEGNFKQNVVFEDIAISSDIIISKAEVSFVEDLSDSSLNYYRMKLFFSRLNDAGNIFESVSDTCSFDPEKINRFEFSLAVNGRDGIVECYNFGDDSGVIDLYEGAYLDCDVKISDKVSLNVDFDMSYGYDNNVDFNLGVDNG